MTAPSRSMSAAIRVDENVSVTAGLAGFVVVFVLALVLWLLMRNMNGRLRGMRYREERRLKDETTEPAAGEEPGSSGPDDPDDQAP